MALDDDIAACADLVRRADPDRFLAVMAAPVAARRVLFPLYAMNVEVARAPWVASEPMIAEMRLQWWRDALAEIASGGPVRRHEVTTPLALVIAPEQAARLDTYVAARRWDVYKDPFQDATDFKTYLNETSGTLLWTAAAALGPADEDAVRDAAFAQGLSNWFRAIPELEARGRKPLVDGRAEAVADLAQQGLDALTRARGRRAKVSVQARPAMNAVWLASVLLRKARSRPYAVANGVLDISEARKKASLLYRSTTGRW